MDAEIYLRIQESMHCQDQHVRLLSNWSLITAAFSTPSQIQHQLLCASLLLEHSSLKMATEQPSRLLGLPQELRNSVLEYLIIAESPYQLQSKALATGRRFNTTSNIILTNKQLCLEYIDLFETTVLAANGARISVTIRDCGAPDVDELHSFLIRLSSSQLATINAESKLQIKLLVSDWPVTLELVIKSWIELRNSSGVRATYEIDGRRAGNVISLPQMRTILGTIRDSSAAEVSRVYTAVLEWEAMRMQKRLDEVEPIIAKMKGGNRYLRRSANHATWADTVAHESFASLLGLKEPVDPERTRAGVNSAASDWFKMGEAIWPMREAAGKAKRVTGA